MLLFLLIALLISMLGVESYKSFHQRHGSRFQAKDRTLQAEMRILIQGTKNAYTTIRAGDVVYYKVNIDDKDRALGLFTSERNVLPLCNFRDKDYSHFYVDESQNPMPAEELLKV